MSDLISRNSVIESIKECAQAALDNHEWDMEQGYLNAIDVIKEEPSLMVPIKDKCCICPHCSNCDVNDDGEISSAEQRSSLTDLYVLDTESGRIHLVGSEQHDSLSVFDGEVHYFNLQNGDGGTAKDGGYVILQTEDGSLVGEYGIVDKRYEKEIEQYLSTNF